MPETSLNLTLSLLILIALVFLVWPLLKTKQSLPNKKWSLVFLVFPMLAILAYFILGNPYHSMMAKIKQPNSQTDLLEKLEARLQKQAGSVADWMLIAPSHLTLKNYRQAEKAFRKVIQLQPQNSDAILGLADSLGMQKNGILLGEAEKWILEAEKIAPDHPLFLQLRIALAQQKGEEKVAEHYLKRLKQPTLATE